MGTWIKNNAVSLLIAMMALAIGYGVVQQKVEGQQAKIAELEQRLRLHEIDAERHIDRRFMDSLVNQLGRVERRLDDISRQ